ncbi:unnamed protein product [Caenorhabditis bovis]|uniref:Uncharacterized protein n=1 Tax=Caenorhabditis bovis TaxID=2654633 RepID=A0A8S1EFG2_9PELO|nr:unnamed protein product [Caenorhabditis bovis]
MTDSEDIRKSLEEALDRHENQIEILRKDLTVREEKLELKIELENTMKRIGAIREEMVQKQENVTKAIIAVFRDHPEKLNFSVYSAAAVNMFDTAIMRINELEMSMRDICCRTLMFIDAANPRIPPNFHEREQEIERALEAVRFETFFGQRLFQFSDAIERRDDGGGGAEKEDVEESEEDEEEK